MPEVTDKHALPDEWRAVADCVDAYETDQGADSADLRKYMASVPATSRRAAMVELIKVDLERRQSRNQPRRVEDYLREYPEIATGKEIVEDLAQQEFLVRSRHGQSPSVNEFSSRFPQLDVAKLPQGEQAFVVTLHFNVSPLETQVLDSKPGSKSSVDAGASGTVEFDTLRKTAVSTGGSRATFQSGSVTSQSASISLPPGSVSLIDPTAAPLGTIGRYTIKQELGSGSFGLVYRCFDEDLKRDVAIKVPHVKAKISAERIKEFQHEAQSAARLRHPGIVTVLDVSQTPDGRAYIVYEFIAGRTLQQHLDEGKYTIADTVRWLADTADALHHAHKNGIVHRDIKPANILIDLEGRPHIADFGLAKMDDQFYKNDAGKVLGTVAYMSPEQAVGQSHWATPQTDVYSLGVMLYQSLTRKLPFQSRSLEEMLLQIRERVQHPRTIDDTIPKAVEAVCLKAMAKNPSDRYTTAADMAADLRTAMAGKPPARRVPVAVVGAAGGAAVIVIALIIAAPWRAKPPERTAPPTQASAAAIVRSPPLPDGAPRLEIQYQTAKESGIWHSLNGKSGALHEGDKIQIHVDLNKPRYVYLYWYDAAGKPKRLFPAGADIAHQQKLERVSEPPEEDKWRSLDGDIGAETVIVAVSDDPLSAGDLAEFEANSPSTGSEVRLDEVFQLASPDVERGLGGVVTSQKNPLAARFREALKKRFASFHGMVVPHQ